MDGGWGRSWDAGFGTPYGGLEKKVRITMDIGCRSPLRYFCSGVFLGSLCGLSARRDDAKSAVDY